MTPTIRATTRADAVEELLDDLSNLLITYYSLPEDQQQASWAADAEKITGHVALALATARARIIPGVSAAPAATAHARRAPHRYRRSDPV